MLRREIFPLILFLVLLGCTINEPPVYGSTLNMKKITKINKEEAISIAKDYIVQKGWANEYWTEKTPKVKLDTLYKYEDGTLSWAKLKTKMSYVEIRERWAVTFAPKKSFLNGGFHLFVFINTETGEVEDAGSYKY